MQFNSAPAKFNIPFADAGDKVAIPQASQIGAKDGAASLTDGFPPLTRTRIDQGGIPPNGKEMNGILNGITLATRWTQAGGGNVYDSAFATAIGGYPKGARILRSDGRGYWLNMSDSNTTDPEGSASASTAAGWVPDMVRGVVDITMSATNYTLTPEQYGNPTISVSGTLTANVNLIFPTIIGEWTVINNTSGNFLLSVKTPSGSGVVLKKTEPTKIYCNGTSIVQVTGSVTTFNDPTYVDDSQQPASTGWIRSAMSAIATAAGFRTLFSNTGYIKFPSWLGGLIIQWGTATTNPSGVASFTFPISNTSQTMAVYANYLNISTYGYLGVTVQSSTLGGTSAYIADVSGTPVGGANIAFLVIGA